MRRPGRLSISVLLAIPLLALPLAAQAVNEVGRASVVRNDVKGTIAGQMSSGSPVHQSETVSAGVESSAQLLFRDETSLTLGPQSQVTIDTFVYDPSRGAGKAAVRLLKGALRFVSGSQSPEDYTVRTPLASMGLRGSVAETFVSGLGYEFFLLIEGGLEVCAAANCRSLTQPGQYVMVSPDGSISPPTAWPGPMLDLTASVDFLQTYFSTPLERGNDVLPRYRDLNDAIRSGDFVAPLAPAAP
jgi:hypothetical protein